MKSHIKLVLSKCRPLCLLACAFLLTACKLEVVITSPISGSSIDSLTVIQGKFPDDLPGQFRLYLVRYSDGKFWAPDVLLGGGAWAWGGGGSAILPTSINTGNKTWQSTGPLPAGSAPETGLTPGYYDIVAIGVATAAKGGKEVRTDSVVSGSA